MTQPATASDSPSSRPQSQRVLACILCQQRKVRCDRKFPCANCLRFGKQCVPASLTPRQRKRRFPERELLDRIRKYEAILQKNHIEFEPLHNKTGEIPASHGASPCSPAENDEESENEQSQHRPTTAATPRESTEAKNLWNVLRQQWSQSSDHAGEPIHDDVSQALIKKAMDQLYVNNDQLLFGLRHTPVVLSTLHPDPVQIFRLWQIYLNNVDPLLKVTHTPTLQGRIIEAISDLERIPSSLEALMFGIYAISTMSLTAEECQTNFHSSRDEILTQYQFACQQALLNCEYLRTNDTECLTAFYLFLLSIGPNTDPRSLSSMLGVAMRIASRLGIHANSDVEKYPPFEAEMRRRLWWALKLIDSRIGELADSKTIALDPIWDCKIPLNVNDAELRPEMKEPPSSSTTSDALFVVVRSVIGDLLRHAEFHLDFTNPQLKSVAKGAQQGLVPENRNMAAIERLVEEKYLKSCNPEIPLHLMTLCMARIQLAKSHMLEHYWRYSDSPEAQTDAQRDLMMRHALTVLEYDARIISSPSTKGYCWLLRFYFPFPAYVHVLQDLLKRPVCSQADKAWQVLSSHFEVRVNVPEARDSPFFDLFTNIVLAAWEKRESTPDLSRSNISVPAIVSIIRDRIAQKSTESERTTVGEQDDPSATELNGVPNPSAFGLHSGPYGLGGRYSQSNAMFGLHPQYQIDTDLNAFHWTTLGWPSSGTAGW